MQPPPYIIGMLNLVIALPCEARPLAARYGLKPLEGGAAFPVYAGDHVRLVVSGCGKAAAAAATGYLAAALPGPRPCAWLNIGVAGHGSAPLDTALLAHKVTDRASGRSYYPAIAFPFPGPTTALVTVDEAETDYPEPCAYDMEGSGFCAAALRFAGAELVHCLKIVSDTPDAPPGRLSGKQVEALMEANLEVVEQLARSLAGLGAAAAALDQDPPWFAEILKRWHFTASEQVQLRHLLKCRHALGAPGPLPEAEWSVLKRGGDVICSLRRRLDALAPPLP